LPKQASVPTKHKYTVANAIERIKFRYFLWEFSFLIGLLLPALWESVGINRKAVRSWVGETTVEGNN
jgi:hypothetical protein